MCGIAGLIDFENSINVKHLAKMRIALKHRGPDGEGSDIEKQVGLTMRRLSIIDVKGGNQPLFNEDKTISIIGNGEIYNFVELRKDLEKLGHKTRTKSDIELAVHAYEEWGIKKAIQKFRGQFALAIHDKKKNLVILVRDRIGEKPLYFTHRGNKFAFASEVKALLTLPWIDKTIDYSAIDDYMHYYYVPEPKTAFQDIYKLPSGHFMTINIKNGKGPRHIQKITKYWDAKDIKINLVGDPTQKIKKEFAKACELTLRSDVPIGISLSGGIDSGSILAFCAPKYRNLQAFSIGYEGTPKTDEREMAKNLARKFGVKFNQIEIKTKDVVKYFPTLVKSMDDPIADIAGHAIYAVSKLARQKGVKVLLGGVGGDELFWGYPSTISATIENVKNSKKSLFNFFQKRHFIFKNPDPKATGFLISNLYSKEFRSQIDKNNFLKYLMPIKQKSRLEIAKHSLALTRDLWLKSDVITLSDRLSMANSIELRSPFLDYKLMEVTLSSKENLLGFTLSPKYWFRKAMKNVLTKEILDRPKQGFTPPVADWIAGINKNYAKLLKNGFLVQSGILDKNKIRSLAGLLENIPAYSIYQLILLEIWGRKFVWD